MMGYWGTGSWFYWFMMIIPILLVVVIVYAVYKILKPSNKEKNRIPNNDPLAILNKRYANGEISDEEYTKMKKNIMDE